MQQLVRCAKCEHFIRGHICRKVPRLHRRSPISPHIGWIAASQAWRTVPAPAIHAMRTILRFLDSRFLTALPSESTSCLRDCHGRGFLCPPLRQGVSQRLAGMVVNQHLNISRADFDRLKATLTNCIRLGAPSQDRAGHDDYRAHLGGRISFVEMVNPARGLRLRALFKQIDW